MSWLQNAIFREKDDLLKLSTTPLVIVYRTLEELSKEFDTEFAIDGKIVDIKNKPLEDAKVSIRITAHTLLKTYIINSAPLLKDGTFKVSGYIGHEIEIDVYKKSSPNYVFIFKINGCEEIKKLKGKPLVITYKTRAELRADKEKK